MFVASFDGFNRLTFKTMNDTPYCNYATRSNAIVSSQVTYINRMLMWCDEAKYV